MERLLLRCKIMVWDLQKIRKNYGNAAKGSDITITQIYAKLTPGQSDPVPLPTALVLNLNKRL